VISRTVGLPGGAEDIGNWAETLGLASLLVEGSLVALGAMVLRERLAAEPGGNKLRAWTFAEQQHS